MTQLGVAIFGLGTVGRAVAGLLAANQAAVAERAGCQLRTVAALVRDPDRHYAQMPGDAYTTADIGRILADPNVHLVVETIGGVDPACDYVLRAMASGRPVALANKELIATSGRRLFAAAADAGVDLLFEASVCSGVPVLRALRGGLAGDRVTALAGVLNGTTNYVLTRMESGVPLPQAIAEAQAAGYAEADPSKDLDGRDAAFKLAILASTAFGRRVSPDVITTRDLGGLTAQDLQLGLDMGLRLKQLAMASRAGEGAVEAWVLPAFLPAGHPLARVEGVDNGVMLTAAAAGRVMLTGPGAGGPAAAAAIVADLIVAARNLRRGVREPGCLCQGEAVAAARPAPPRYWLRVGRNQLERLLTAGLPVERELQSGDDGRAVITGPLASGQLESLSLSGHRAFPIFEEYLGPVRAAAGC